MTTAADPITTLLTQLQQLVSDGTLTIAPGTITPSSTIPGLFTNFLQNRSLVISGVQLSIPSGLDFVQIFGTAADDNEPFSNMELDGRVTWSAAKSEYELTLFGTSSDIPWTLAKSFAFFRASDPLGFVQIDAPQWVLSSDGGFSTTAGLTFSGSVPFTGAQTSPLVSLFPGTSSVNVSGAVSSVDNTGRPFFSFSGESTQSLVIAGLFKNIVPALELAFGPLPTGGAPVSQLYAVWDLHFGKDKLSIYTRYPFDDPVLTFTADVSKTVGFVFGVLSQLTGGTNFGLLMPGQLPIPLNFGVSLWTVGVNGFDLSLVSFSLQAATTQPWPIVAGITLENVGFEFDISSDSSLTLILSTNVDLGQGAILSLSGAYPGFAFGGSLTSGGIDLHTLVNNYSPDAALLIPCDLDLTTLTLAVDPSSSVYRFSTTVGSPTAKWPITFGSFAFNLDQIALDFGATAGQVDAKASATLALSSATDAPTVTMAAEYKTGAGWTFSGQLTDITSQQLVDSMTDYFPSLAPILSALGLDSITVPLLAIELRPNDGYTFTAQIVWTLSIASEPLVITGSINLQSDAAGNHTGTITGSAQYETLILTVKHDLKTGGPTDFFWSDFHGTLKPPSIVFDFGTLTLGDLVTEMVDAVVQGGGFALVTPFDLLNSLTLSGLSVTLDFATKTATLSVGTSLASFGFLDVQQLGFTIDWKQPSPPVSFAVTQGSFLGQKIDPTTNPVGWNLLDPTGAQTVPGVGNGLFEIDFLALGQRFRPLALDTTTVESAVATLETAFLKKGDPNVGLVYAPEANWVIALKGLFFHDSIVLNALFLDDPPVYGISIFVNPNGRISQFANLHFEILYKKIGNDIGLYHAMLTLPDSIRYLDFGAVGITLPDFEIWIYTNGNFKVDFGFPYNNDFSLSFAVQMLPFMGSGGFYFGALSGATDPDVPQHRADGSPIPGSFSPVIAFGIGVAVGLGGTLNYGIASGGLSLLLTGIIEGVFATYNPYGQSPASNDFFWGIKGQAGITGRLFGIVNFVVIVARFDATITVSIAALMAAYQPVTFTFTASISVSASIRINLGLFSITIGFSFDLSISDSYTVGSLHDSPWDPNAISGSVITRHRLSHSLSEADTTPLLLTFTWAPVTSSETFTLWLVPHTTAASAIDNGVLQPSKAQIVATTYIGRGPYPAPQPPPKQPPPPSDFAILAQGVLLWLVNSALNGKEATKAAVEAMPLDYDQASDIFTLLGNGTAFDLTALTAFLSHYGVFTIQQRQKDNATNIDVSVFPIAPTMTLQINHGTPVPFSSVNETSAADLAAIQQELMAMQPGPGGSASPASTVTDEVALSTFLFLDYFSLIAKGVIQGAIDLLKQPTTQSTSKTVSEIAGGTSEQAVQAVRGLARRNRTRRLRAGMTLTIPRTARFAGGTKYSVKDRPAETLLGVSRRFGTSAEELAVANAETAIFAENARILMPAGTPVTVSDIITTMQNAGAFDNLAGQVARIFLQGLRPPWPDPTGPPQALYSISGQEFDASAMKSGDTYALAVPAGTKWIDATDGVVKLDDQDARFITAMNGTSISPSFTSAVQPYRSTMARRFTLSAPVPWTTAGSTVLQTIRQLPANLTQLMAANPGLDPTVILHEDTSDGTNLEFYPVGDAADPPAHQWATAFSIDVTRVPSSASPDTNLPNTYSLAGTDTVGAACLEQLLRINFATPVDIDQIYILFPLRPGTALPSAGLTSDPLTGNSFFVMQTNLSTASNPPTGDFVSADVADTAVDPVGMTSIEMLRLMWECSAVRSGGYQLYYDHAKNGLPDFLFAKDGTAELTILVTYTTTADVLQPFMNAVLLTQPVDHDSIVYLESVPPPGESPLLERSLAMTAGHAGFTASRTFTGGTTPAEFLDQQYQLLEYRVSGSPDFNTGTPGLPLTPTVNDGVDAYVAVVPIAGLAKDPGASTGLTGAPLPADDPYRGVGKSVAIALEWHDIFGNVITTTAKDPAAYTVNAPVLYFDDLIPLSAWPGLGLSYTIANAAAGGAPTLTVTIKSDPSRYDPSNAQVGTNWLNIVAADQQQYAAIYYQIARNAKITMVTSLDPKNAGGDITQQVIGLVVDIYAYLTSLLATKKFVARTNAIAPAMIVADSSDAALFPLTTIITIERTAFVHSTAGAAAGSAASEVKALLQPAGDAAKPGTLVEFATGVQTAFPELHVGTCTPDSIAGIAAVWLMRLGGTGYSCSFSNPHYYSLAPLAVLPVSLSNVTIYSYDGTTPLPNSPTTTQSFSNVDLDGLAARFFAAMDQFLSPDYVINAWNIAIAAGSTPNPVSTILLAKETLASAIAGGLAAPYASQIADPDPFLAAATDKLIQELLIRLSSAVQIDSIVSVLATVGGPDGELATAPRLYGKPVEIGTKVATNSFTISTASVPLVNTADSAYMAFTFSVKDAQKAAVVDLATEFDPTHVQFNLQPMPPPISGYTASSWLTFVTPLATGPIDGDLGTLAIPIPLKAFPTAPALVSQTAAGYPEQDGKVATTRLWEYSFVFGYAAASQDPKPTLPLPSTTTSDDVHLRIDFAAPSPGTNAADTPDLPTLLVQFSAVWPQILADFNQYLLTPGTNDTRAAVAMQSFAWLAGQIASAWSSGAGQFSDVTADPTALQFVMRQESVDLTTPVAVTGALEITTTAPAGFPPPFIDIAGFTTTPVPEQSGAYIYTVSSNGTVSSCLGFDTALGLPQRTVRLAGDDATPEQVFDLLAQQQAWGSVSIWRNEFYGQEPGNEAFIFRTPFARSVTPAVPQLAPQVTLNMALNGPTPGPAPLLDYLQGFLAALLTPRGGTAPIAATVQLSAAFRYQLGEQLPLNVDVPILLTVPQQITPDSQLVTDIATQINGWIAAHDLAQRPGTLLFTLALFNGATPLPVLQLNDIELDAALVKWGGS